MAAPWPRVRFRQPNYVRDLPPLPFEEPLGPPGSSLVCGPRRGDLPSAMIVHPDIVGSVPRSAIPIVMAATYEGWARAGKTFHPSPPLCPGIHATALVAPGAEVEGSAVRRAGGRPQMSTMRFDDRSADRKSLAPIVCINSASERIMESMRWKLSSQLDRAVIAHVAAFWPLGGRRLLTPRAMCSSMSADIARNDR